MTVRVRIATDAEPCGWCSGTGCTSCRGSGERAAEYYEWECLTCRAAGEGIPADERCPGCGEARIWFDTAPDDEADFDDDPWEYDGP